MATLRIYVLQRSRVVLRVPQWAVDNLEGTARITELLLKSPISLWPVKTGRSKTGMKVRVGPGHTLRVTNVQSYAKFVERKTRKASLTIRVFLPPALERRGRGRSVRGTVRFLTRSPVIAALRANLQRGFARQALIDRERSGR